MCKESSAFAGASRCPGCGSLVQFLLHHFRHCRNLHHSPIIPLLASKSRSKPVGQVFH